MGLTTFPPGGGSSVTSATATTATNTAITVPGHDLFQGLWPTGTTIVSFSSAAAGPQSIGTGSHGDGYVVPEVVFTGAPGGNCILRGFDRWGAAQVATITNPGGAGTVVATVAFSLMTEAENATPAGAGTVTVRPSQWLAMSQAPVATFFKLTISGVDEVPTDTNLAQGMIELGTSGGYDGSSTYGLTYAYPLNLTQASHTHTLA